MAKRQLWELVKDREKSAIRRSEVLKSTLTETHIAALLGEAAALQEKVVQLLTRAQEVEKAEGLTAEKAKLNAVDVLNTILEARRLESAAAGKLQVALDLSRLVQSWREDLRDSEARLRKAREDLERIEKIVREP